MRPTILFLPALCLVLCPRAGHAQITYSPANPLAGAIIGDSNAPNNQVVAGGPVAVAKGSHGVAMASIQVSAGGGTASALGYSDITYGHARASVTASWQVGQPVTFIWSTSGNAYVFAGNTIAQHGNGSVVRLSGNTIKAEVDFADGGSGPREGRAVVSWGWGGVAGQTPENRHQGWRPKDDNDDDNDDDDDDDDDSVLHPIGVSGGYLVADIPVVDSYGHSDYFYTEPIEPTGGQVPVSFVTDNSFTAMTLPAGYGGDETYLLQFGVHTLPITWGSTIDFTSYIPGGVRSFQLAATSSFSDFGLASVDYLPDVVGLKFANEGPTRLFLATAVPEPSSVVMGAAALIGLLAYAHRRRTFVVESNRPIG